MMGLVKQKWGSAVLKQRSRSIYSSTVLLCADGRIGPATAINHNSLANSPRKTIS